MAATTTTVPPQNRADTNQVFLYFGAFIFLIAFVNPVNYFTDVSTTFMLKDRLHASASQVSTFRFVTALPIYLAFAFGLLRDRWNPFGLKDRGLLMLFGPITAALFIMLALQTVSLFSLYLGVLAVMLSTRMIVAAYQGLISLIGQEKLMSGRLAVVWNGVYYIPTAAASWLAGFAADQLKPGFTFAGLAILCLLVGVFGIWKPKGVFAHAYDQPQARNLNFKADVVRLLKHKAIYAPVLMMFLWNFAPGSQTPLQYYLTNTLHASDAAYADFNAIFTLAFIPTFLLYGVLCTKMPLNKLLFWGIVVAVPQMIPLLFMHSASSALWLAAPIGLMGGIATGGIYDLSIRSCPPGLQGTLMLMVDGVYYLSQRAGDILGSYIFGLDSKNGFLYCVIAITIVYALILPCMKLVPTYLMATSDGEENAGINAQLVAELNEKQIA
jgi:hypothetical protein